MSFSFLATNHFFCTSFSISHKPLRRETTLPPMHQVAAARSNRVAQISCEYHHQQQKEITKKELTHVIDRRNMLVGLGGGLYGATTVANKAVGAPIQPPDITKCKMLPDDGSGEALNCCLPYSTRSKVIDFEPPSNKEPMRVRKPAHMYTPDDVAKFEKAIELMKALPDDDPRNFWQQATIHCTFCNGAFDQTGNDGVPLLVHGSWLFLPWHRWYLYFWERILGKLIDDPTFAVPFWNWDTPDGMFMPTMYWKNKGSPLYDDTRDKDHHKMFLDYDYSPTNPRPHNNASMRNLCRVNRDFSEAETETSLFMGKPLTAGKPVSASGSCEGLHNMMHNWVGAEGNMGNFATAARDPIFYAHHANVDRMWDMFTKSRGNRPEFRERDWLHSAFIFVDENKNIVKVKVRDCLRPEQLKYAYSEEKQPWKKIVDLRCNESISSNKLRTKECKAAQVSVFGAQPRSLKAKISALVKRPTWSNIDKKETREEILVIKNIEYSTDRLVKFDVYVTPAIKGKSGSFDSVCTDTEGEKMRSFQEIPHRHRSSAGHGSARLIKTEHRVGITKLVENIDSDMVVVTLVPQEGEMNIAGIEIYGSKIDLNN